MNIFTSELLGTAILIILGNGVVANVVLNKTKGNNSGWIVITFGWAMAVFVGVFVSSKVSGAHLNPAITLAFAYLEKIQPAQIAEYLGGQMIGAMLGSLFVWLAYKDHYTATDDTGAKLATFCTAPAIRKPINNFITEMVGTFVFVLAVFFIIAPQSSLGALDALPVAFIVFAIGLSLGGPTGYAINPVRDFGPRLMHSILPIGKKGSSDWAYSWVPILGPIVGALLAAMVYKQLM
ncbi:MAG TPA: MIP/aquaporin family protein [Niabella sp.]|nr:MIP/aquaporin family protein [Niabella sp.]HOZ96542.1 MIP/aquaporin family protein [Niabella sp.]HQW13277.1 MIP/aquaporin family protein [Niabella sp.]HQX18683.1 MIP/aquaporin family protein [Niabella sp.]HQX40336.1 MIP/aquaporin family protein [Niabella sp.]